MINKSMSFNYLVWQFYFGPRWIATVAWNIQRGILQYFSVPVMLRTLFSHWHKDRLAYKSATLTGYVKIWALNLISRAIGFIVRSVILSAWLVIEAAFIPIALGVFMAFLIWPFLTVVSLLTGIILIWLGNSI